MSKAKPKTKPGYKTTEFWLSFIAVVMGFVMTSGVLENAGDDSVVAKIVGGVIAVLAALGYTTNRTKVKNNGGNS